MTCYRVNWTITEDQLERINVWLHPRREELGLLRGIANPGLILSTGDEVWRTRYTFKHEAGVRAFYREWDPSYTEDREFTPWGDFSMAGRLMSNSDMRQYIKGGQQ